MAEKKKWIPQSEMMTLSGDNDEQDVHVFCFFFGFSLWATITDLLV